jgi:Holliday junction resolvasome RuvABC endonuclease subunit
MIRRARPRDFQTQPDPDPTPAQVHGDAMLALDPSSHAVGWAVFREERLVRCGVWRPGSGPLWSRVARIGEAVAQMLVESRASLVVVEVTSGKTYKKERASSLASLMAAQASAVEAARGPGRGTPVHPVTELEWTRGVPKKKRASLVAATEPVYAAYAHKDKGLDAADACGVGRWWISKRRWEQLRGA